MIKSEILKPDTRLYFAYAADMLTFRIHMHTPGAEFVSIARLDNFRLDFNKYSRFWRGPTGTLVPTANAHTWGVIWRIHKDDIPKLDEQKGFRFKKNFVRHVKVLTPYMGYFTCRAYIQKMSPLPRGEHDPIPVERWPSWGYKQVLVMGAREHGLPPYYEDYLRALRDNGDEGCMRTACLLDHYGRGRPCQCMVPGRIPRKPLKFEVRKGPPRARRPAKPKYSTRLPKIRYFIPDNVINSHFYPCPDC